MADPPQMQQTQQVNEPPPPDLLNHGHGEKGANGTAAAPVKQEKHKVCDIILCDLFNCTNLTEICIMKLLYTGRFVLQFFCGFRKKNCHGDCHSRTVSLRCSQ